MKKCKKVWIFALAVMLLGATPAQLVRAAEPVEGTAMTAEKSFAASVRDFLNRVHTDIFESRVDGNGLAFWTDVLKFGGEKDAAVHDQMSKQDFTDILMVNRSVWELPESEQTPGSGMYCPGYKLIDFNLDGELELMVSYSGGSMLNAPSEVYAVTKEGLIQYHSKYEGSGDQLMSPEIGDVKLYYDTLEDRYVYIEDRHFKSWPETYSGYRRLEFVDYMVNSQRISGKTQDMETGQCKYDINGEEVSESEYEQQYNDYFNGRLRDANLRHGFVKNQDWYTYSDSQKRQALSDLYDAFYYDGMQ